MAALTSTLRLSSCVPMNSTRSNASCVKPNRHSARLSFKKNFSHSLKLSDRAVRSALSVNGDGPKTSAESMKADSVQDWAAKVRNERSVSGNPSLKMLTMIEVVHDASDMELLTVVH